MASCEETLTSSRSPGLAEKRSRYPISGTTIARPPRCPGRSVTRACPQRKPLADRAVGPGVEREDRPPHVAEGELRIVRSADADAGAFDDLPRQRAERGAPMHPALYRQKALVARLDPQHAEHVWRDRLDLPRHQH